MARRSQLGFPGGGGAQLTDLGGDLSAGSHCSSCHGWVRSRATCSVHVHLEYSDSRLTHAAMVRLYGGPPICTASRTARPVGPLSHPADSCLPLRSEAPDIPTAVGTRPARSGARLDRRGGAILPLRLGASKRRVTAYLNDSHPNRGTWAEEPLIFHAILERTLEPTPEVSDLMIANGSVLESGAPPTPADYEGTPPKACESGQVVAAPVGRS